MIDRYLLRYFLAVIDHGNFSRAARECNVSQPTLSVGIAKLERELDRPLFHRTNRRVELTEAGAHFAVHARRIEAEFGLAEKAVLGDAAHSIFRLGTLTTMPARWIGAFVERLSRSNARQRVELVEGRERDLIEGLSRGRIDAALTILRDEGSRFAGESLFVEGYSLAMAAGHPLSGQAVIAAEALADNSMIVRRQCELLSETSRHFTRRGVRPFFAARTMNDERALELVRAGLGVTIMPDCFTAAGVARPRMADFNFTREIGILHAPHVDQATHGERAAVGILRETIRDLAAGA